MRVFYIVYQIWYRITDISGSYDSDSCGHNHWLVDWQRAFLGILSGKNLVAADVLCIAVAC